MKTFYNNSLFTGYLKQLLHEVNLPNYRIYTKQDREYFEKYNKENYTILETKTLKNNEQHTRYIPYIKDGFIQEYVDGKWEKRGAVGKTSNNENLNANDGAHVHFYTDGMNILNYTKKLNIKDGVYDSYTHEYLGEYLRFLRDYYNVNLMSLYNCFSDRAATNINLKFSISKKVDSENSEIINCEFADNDLYKLYVVPVKLFKNYTIAIDSAQAVELCCVIYDKTLDSRMINGKFKDIPGLTYQKIRECSFGSPILYDKLNSADIIRLSRSNNNAELAQSENNLKLLIKLPKNNDSTIVILEGDYRGWNDSMLVHNRSSIIDRSEAGKIKINCSEEDNTKGKVWTTLTNNSIINKDKIVDDIPFELRSPLQLLRFNTKKQHPYADKLESYLLGNVISELDDISSDIKRVQQVMSLNGYRFSYEGLWTDGIREIAYDYIINNHNDFDTNHDVLGYIDKDVEKYYSACVNIKDINGNIIRKERDSLLSVELEEDR